jgi:hypothetical protein
MFYIENSTTLIYYTPNSGEVSRTVPTISTGTWYHFAVVSSASTISIYWNGTRAGATFSGTPSHSAAGVALGVDRWNAILRPYNGYIDEVRITKGVARYTSDFTPSTSSFGNADGSLDISQLPATPAAGDIVYSTKGFYVCSSASPVTWKEYALTPSTITV